ncbi:MAG: hypothetical protein GY832_31665 [Chloroflexi bacterium]|nr:hypothetical protein [Chloroflexota bacterium]
MGLFGRSRLDFSSGGGITLGSTETPLKVSPQGAAVPTASALAIQDNSTSGEVVLIKSTPGSASGVTVLRVEADGSNWIAGSTVVELRKDDADTRWIEFKTASTLTGYFTGAASGLQLHSDTGDLQFTTGNAKDITLTPDTTGSVILKGVPNVVGDAETPDLDTPTNDDLEVTGRLKVHGDTWFDGSIVVHGSKEITKNGTKGCSLSLVESYELVTIAATESTAVTSLEIPVGASIMGVAVRVYQAPGGGPSNFNIGIDGGDADIVIDNGAVAASGVFTMFEDGDGTHTSCFGTGGSAMSFGVTVTDGADTPVAVTGDSFIVRLSVFYYDLATHSS